MNEMLLVSEILAVGLLVAMGATANAKELGTTTQRGWLFVTVTIGAGFLLSLVMALGVVR